MICADSQISLIHCIHMGINNNSIKRKQFTPASLRREEFSIRNEMGYKIILRAEEMAFVNASQLAHYRTESSEKLYHEQV